MDGCSGITTPSTRGDHALREPLKFRADATPAASSTATTKWAAWRTEGEAARAHANYIGSMEIRSENWEE